MQNDYQNPFDNNNHQFFILKNALQQQSLWPTFIPIPEGWEKTFGPDEKQKCLDYVEQV